MSPNPNNLNLPCSTTFHQCHNKIPLAPSRSVTRLRNASAHPRTDAKQALSNHRDPEIIEQEKFDHQANKDAKEQQKADDAARKKAAQHHIEELRAQQTTVLEEEECEIPHQQPGTRTSTANDLSLSRHFNRQKKE